MNTRTDSSSPQVYARVGGWLYLLLVPLGFFTVYVSSTLVVPGDAATTIGHITGSEMLFRLGIVSALLVQVVNIFVVLALYQLLKPVNRNMAALMVVLILVGVPIAMLNELNSLAVLRVLNGTSEFTGLVPLFLDLHQLGISIASIFWGLWLLPMGYLVYRSGFIPWILGVLLIIGGLGYLVESFAAFLAPDWHVNIVLFTFWGEVLFPLWLVVKGINMPQWEKRAVATV